jgi:anaerobic selenocysteine-containing dehydrogenase
MAAHVALAAPGAIVAESRDPEPSAGVMVVPGSDPGDREAPLSVQRDARAGEGELRMATSFCRLCGGKCGTVLQIDADDRIVTINGDRANPLTAGYICSKGRGAAEMHRRDDRILRPLKRQADGSFTPIALEEALDEIATQASQIIEAHGPVAIGSFLGTHGYLTATAGVVLSAWMRALGSPNFFSALTIDASNKLVTLGRLGGWAAGKQSFQQANVWLLFGSNPLLSLSGTAGMPPANPQKALKEAKARGLVLIVIDPRRTETAQHADLFIQPRPGEDPAIAAGLLHVILEEGLEDREFCAKWTVGLDALREAVEPFTAEFAAERAGITAAEVRRAARLFAAPDRYGCAGAATGVAMAPYSNLSDHLVECLNVVCGRYRRAGEPLHAVPPFLPRSERRAEVIPPNRTWEHGHKTRTGHGRFFTPEFGHEMPTGVLADEILTPGPGQIRALFVEGGNPAVAIPDQRKIVAALRSVDLLVSIDAFMSATARLAHYVLPPRLLYERADLPGLLGAANKVSLSFAQYTGPIVTPPAGAEVTDDWYVYWGLARRMGRTLTIAGTPLDMNVPPTTDDLLSLITRDGRVSLDELREAPHGRVFDFPAEHVQPGRSDEGRHFEVMPGDVRKELDAYAKRRRPAGHRHLLTVRRMRHVINSLHPASSGSSDQKRHNPAFLHPEDLDALGIVDGARVDITSSYGTVTAVAAPDDRLRRGVVSMAHCFGGLPEDPDKEGACTNLLISTEAGREAHNAMPWMSAVPVSVRAHDVGT